MIMCFWNTLINRVINHTINHTINCVNIVYENIMNCDEKVYKKK